MRKVLSSIALVAVLVSVPALARAQQRRAATMSGAKHEFGVDIGIGYVKPDGVDGGIVIGTPIDVRVGLVSGKKMMWEPRFTLGFSTVGGATTYDFEPGVNVLIANGPGLHRNGMYFTGGGGLLLADNGATNGTAFSLNAGVGWRKPYGSGAWRYELGFKWQSESTDLGLPSTITVGARIGLSLWH
ncbi:MAG TPA: hypothetical protein VGQ18_08820 [Gemmatimonadales bacterium]|jgi:hypothetical protein|nr:hypothetical protein [Gemmatimonadales bacterium]